MKKRAIIWIVAMALALVVWGLGWLPIWAQAQPAADSPGLEQAEPPPEAADEEEPEKETYKVLIEHADKLFYDASTKVYHLTGNVVMVHEDITLYCDQCDYDDNNNTAVATGHLKITDPESTITGDRVEADFDEKLAIIIGNVTIVTQKKPEEGEEGAEESEEGEEEEKGLEEYREKETTITCPQIDYYYAKDTKKATVYGPVKAVQEDKTAWADQAFYDGIKDEVILEGNVRVLTDNGSEFRCPRAVISLEEDWIRAENVTGIAITEEEEEETPAGGTSEEPPAPPEETTAPPTEAGSPTEENPEGG